MSGGGQLDLGTAPFGPNAWLLLIKPVKLYRSRKLSRAAGLPCWKTVTVIPKKCKVANLPGPILSYDPPDGSILSPVTVEQDLPE
jgi:hypothetical protein